MLHNRLLGQIHQKNKAHVAVSTRNIYPNNDEDKNTNEFIINNIINNNKI